MRFLDESPETIFSLREKFAAFCRPGTPEKPALKTICMVGAYNSPNGMPWYDLDKLYLELTLRRLNANNIPVDPEFEIEIENKDPQEGGKDFLERTKPADIVVICCIFNPPAWEAPLYSADHGAGHFTISKKHFEKTAWHDAAARIHAKIISIMGNDFSSEIGPSHFAANDNSRFVRLESHHESRMHFLRNRDFTP